MTGDEAISPVRALRPVPPPARGEHTSTPEGLHVDLEAGGVEVLVRVSPEGRKHDNLIVLGDPHDGTAEALAELLPEAHLIAPSVGDLGGRHRKAPGIRASSERAVVQLMDHFAIERAVFVGTERGADLAVAVAAHHPDRVGALVLVNGGLGEAPAAEASPTDGAEARDALSGLRVPVALLFGGAGAESRGYTPASVRSTTSWLRHVDAQEVEVGDDGVFETPALAAVADIVQTQLASVRARAAHPATGSHRIIAPADDES
ncbi:alpha/beta fold hydrolase [Pseudoclavibacter helvolus]|uniref:alpha/beta fold hydrolase n=1 Tax=Pseudoclavibacter helvolus TaxID=255205 RepID=UPI003C76531E